MAINDTAAKRKERQAWLVLVTSFLVFALLLVLIPYSVRRYYLNATVAKEGVLEIIAGTVLYTRPGSSVDFAAINREPILEGYTIKTDSTSRAIATFFDGSTVQIFENSELSVRKLRTSRFSQRQSLIILAENRGRIRAAVAPPGKQTITFQLDTPHSSMILSDGSYAIEAGPHGTSLSVRDGEGEITAQKASVTVKRGLRSDVAPGAAPSVPQRAALDLITNGDFRQGDLGWTKKIDVEAGRKDEVPGATEFLTEPEGPALHIVRRGSRDSHGENSILQGINRDVSDFVSLKLSLDFRLVWQSLSGGGYLGSEYPLMLRLVYRDATGAQITWVRGFYYHNTAGYPTTNGEQVPVDVNIPYEQDLLALDGFPKPFRLLSLEIGASGWDYESVLRSVSILAE